MSLFKLKIYTNSKPRPIIYGFELTDKERLEFNYLEDIDSGQFFKYKNNVYDISEFIITKPATCKLDDFKDYDAYMEQSAFNGLLIKLCDDEHLIVASYYI